MERSVLCSLVPMCPSPMEMGHMGLEYTGTDKSSASWSQCVPDPWKWDTWDWSAQGEISPLLPGPSVSQLHGHGTHGTGVHMEKSVICVLVPMCPSTMETGHNGTSAQWDWRTKGEISLLCPCPSVSQPHGNGTQWDWDTMGLEHTGRDQSSCPGHNVFQPHGNGTQHNLDKSGLEHRGMGPVPHLLCLTVVRNAEL